ncbi:MAG TPA: glycine--tRNA ligase [Thermoplasmatales archaeon]|nr:glycine--tRNA ligase [Thermoplasmatales archaeon]
MDIYDKLMTLAKRRGFLYPSFEIYGGVAGFYDYGPLGSQMKNNLENLWRKYYILNENFLEISTPTITLYEVLKASGHVDEFTDLTGECPKCHNSYKIEDLEKPVCPKCKIPLENIHPVNLMFPTKIGVGNTRDAFLRPETAQGIFTSFHLLYRYAREHLPFGVVQLGRGYRNEVSPRQGPLRMREFSMAEAEIFFDPNNKTHIGFNEIKHETIRLNDNIKEQVLTLEEAVNNKIIHSEALAYYLYLTQSFLLDAGVDREKLRFRKHASDELAHYAQECWDAELYSERFGWIECVGIADRSAYDLEAHTNASGVELIASRRYETPKKVRIKRIIPNMKKLGPLFKEKAGRIKTILEELKPEDDEINVNLDGEEIHIPRDCYEIIEKEETITQEKFIPHVIEPSYGIDRIFYCILEHSFYETEKNNEIYRILKLKPIIAPIKTGVFPLVNDEKLVSIAKKIDKTLRDNGIQTYYDNSGSIGRRYARMDEIGTPFCITIDYDTLNDNSVTIRDRDTTKQERIPIDNIVEYISSRL